MSPECAYLDTGYWILDTGILVLNPGYWDTGTESWILVLNPGYWILDTGYWILEPGYWALLQGSNEERPGILDAGVL